MTNELRRVCFHIKGMDKASMRDGVTGNPNYVLATLNYTPKNGWCYYWRISPVYKYMVDGVEFIAEPFGLSVATGSLKESLVKCARKSKAKEAEACEYFDSNVVSAIIHRLKYNIELEETA